MANAEIITKTNENLSEKINFLNRYYQTCWEGFASSISDQEKLKKDQCVNEISEIQETGDGIVVDDQGLENNTKTIYTKNAYDCIIIGCVDKIKKTRALWHMNFRQGKPTNHLNSLGSYLKNSSKDLKIAVLSGYYSSNLLEVFNVIKNNNCSINYADIFPLYGCDKIKQEENIFVYVDNSNTTVQKDLKDIEVPVVFNGVPYHGKSLAITPEGEFVIPILPEKCGDEIKPLKYLKDTYHQSLYEEIEEMQNKEVKVLNEKIETNNDDSLNDGGKKNATQQPTTHEEKKDPKKRAILFPITLTCLFFIHLYFLLKSTKISSS